MNKEKIRSVALRTIETETNAVSGLRQFINEDFVKATEQVAGSKGRLVVSGIGKSAIVAQKIVATLNSTGTPALFMHAADAIHGDLGMIVAGDAHSLPSGQFLLPTEAATWLALSPAR